MDSLNVCRQVRFVLKAFAAACVWAREGRRGSGVDGVDVFGEVAFFCEALATNRTRIGWRGSRMEVSHVSIEDAF